MCTQYEVSNGRSVFLDFSVNSLTMHEYTVHMHGHHAEVEKFIYIYDANHVNLCNNVNLLLTTKYLLNNIKIAIGTLSRKVCI